MDVRCRPSKMWLWYAYRQTISAEEIAVSKVEFPIRSREEGMVPVTLGRLHGGGEEGRGGGGVFVFLFFFVCCSSFVLGVGPRGCLLMRQPELAIALFFFRLFNRGRVTSRISP